MVTNDNFHINFTFHDKGTMKFIILKNAKCFPFITPKTSRKTFSIFHFAYFLDIVYNSVYYLHANFAGTSG